MDFKMTTELKDNRKRTVAGSPDASSQAKEYHVRYFPFVLTSGILTGTLWCLGQIPLIATGPFWAVMIASSIKGGEVARRVPLSRFSGVDKELFGAIVSTAACVGIACGVHALTSRTNHTVKQSIEQSITSDSVSSNFVGPKHSAPQGFASLSLKRLGFGS
jgi:hypothetical protein